MLDLQKRYRLEPLSAGEVRGRSRGPITKNPVAADLYYIEGTLHIEPGGFESEELFGPFDAPHLDGFAHIDLAVPLAHPFFPGAVLTALPVLPAAFRPVKRSAAGVKQHRMTGQYGSFYALHTRMKRLIELGAPDEIVDNDRERLVLDLAALFDNAFAEKPLVYSDGERLEGLAARLATRDLAELDAVLYALGLGLSG